jgi:hypothetical protein
MTAVCCGESERSATAQADDRSLGSQSRGSLEDTGLRDNLLRACASQLSHTFCLKASRSSGEDVVRLRGVGAGVDQARLSGAGL